MRDTLKDEDYFRQIIKFCLESENRRLSKFEKKLIQPERVIPVQQARASNLLNLVIAKYSIGDSIIELLDFYQRSVMLVHESWDDTWKLKKGNPPVIYDQYIISAYDEMLWLLSIGVLLGSDKKYIELLVKVLDKDNINNDLFEFLISSKINNRKNFTVENEDSQIGIRNIFSSLLQAIEEKDPKKSESLVKKFLNEEWYNGHKDASWYNNHKSETYLGYWCFEAAAVTCIKGLDDSSYRDHPYYPKDLADFYRANR